jgi:hypothetical protein
MEYKLVRLFTFFAASFLPLIITVIVAISSFLYLGNDFIGVGIVTILSAFFSVVVCGFAGFQITGQNAWVKAVQGEAMLLFAYSSTGTGQIFSCVTKQNPSGGIDVVAKLGKEEAVLAYDKPMSYRVLSPIRGIMELIHPKKNDDFSSDKAKTVITIVNEDFDKYAMRFGYLTVLFFNNETGTLTNKFAVNELEKFYAMKYLSLHLDRKMDIYISELRMARKNFFDALLNQISAFLKSPMFPVLALAIGAFFVLVLIVMMWPQISGFFGQFFPKPMVGVDANVIVSPIVHGNPAISPLK